MTTTLSFIQGEPDDQGARLRRKDGGHHEEWNPIEGRWIATSTLLRSTPGEDGKAIRPVGERTAMADLMVKVEGLAPVDVEVARRRWPSAFIRERSQPA